MEIRRRATHTRCARVDVLGSLREFHWNVPFQASASSNDRCDLFSLVKRASYALQPCAPNTTARLGAAFHVQFCSKQVRSGGPGESSPLASSLKPPPPPVEAGEAPWLAPSHISPGRSLASHKIAITPLARPIGGGGGQCDAKETERRSLQGTARLTEVAHSIGRKSKISWRLILLHIRFDKSRRLLLNWPVMQSTERRVDS